MHLRILISNLLQVEVDKRIGVEDIKKSEWFESVNWNDIFLKKVEPPKVSFRQLKMSGDLEEYEDFTLLDLVEDDIQDEFSDF